MLKWHTRNNWWNFRNNCCQKPPGRPPGLLVTKCSLRSQTFAHPFLFYSWSLEGNLIWHFSPLIFGVNIFNVRAPPQPNYYHQEALSLSHQFDKSFQSDMSSSSMENPNATGTEVKAAVQPVVCTMINGRSWAEGFLMCAIILGLWKGLEVLDWIIKKIFLRLAMQENQLRIEGNNLLVTLSTTVLLTLLSMWLSVCLSFCIY